MPTHPGFPRVTGESYGAGVFNVIGEGADAFLKIQDTADRMEAARVAGEATETIAGTIRNNNQQIADPDEFVTRTSADIDSAHKTARDSLKNDHARKLFDSATANDLAKAKKALEFDRYRKTGEMALGNFEIEREQLLNQSIGAPEEVQRQNYEKLGTALGTLQKGNLITPKQAADMGIDFHKKLTMRSAEADRLRDPGTFLVESQKGKYDAIPLDERLKMGEQARDAIHKNEARGDEVKKKITQAIENEWSAQANFGQLNSALLDQALKGAHPYITADKARALKSINDNPPTGEGGDQVLALRMQYRLTEGSERDVRLFNKRLTDLQMSVGRPNKTFLDFANELQADLFRAQNQNISRESNEIARQNREIRNLQTSYEAWVESNPMLKPLLGNTSERDKARIAEAYRKDGPESAKKMLDGLIKKTEPKAKAAEQKHGKATNWNE